MASPVTQGFISVLRRSGQNQTVLQRLRASRGGLVANAGGAFGINAASVGLRFVFQVVYARLLGVGGYGVFAYALSWAQMIAPASTLGYNWTVLAYVPRYEVERDWGRLRGLIRRSLQLTTGVGLALAAGLSLAWGLTSSGGSLNRALVAGFLLIPLLGLLLLYQELLRSLHHVLLGYGLTALVQPLLAMAGALMLYARGSFGVTQVLLAYAVASLAVVGLQALAVSRSLPTAAKQARPVRDDGPWRNTSAALFVTSMLQRVIYQSDIVLVGLLRGPRDAGLYAVASRVAQLGLIVMEAVNAAVAPTISGLYAAGDQRRLQRAVSTGVQLTLWPSLVVSAVVAVCAGPVLSLFGTEFADARWALVLLAAGNVVNAATGPCGYLLALTGQEKASLKIAAVHAVANVAICAALIQIAGRNGAALGHACILASWNITISVVVRRKLAIRSYPQLPRRQP